MSDIWITSDTHYHHKNIIEGVSDWENKSRCRPFSSIEEHNEIIVANINRYVKKNDVLWHLGDWSFGGIRKIWEFRRRINCKNIHLILGNHDHHIETDKTLIVPIQDVTRLYELKIHYIAHPDLLDGVYIPAKGLFSSVNHVTTEKFFGHRVFMSHYAHRIWNHSHKGVIHLYGHSHDTLPDIGGKTMDVGLESAKRILGEYRPFKWQEIQSIMANRSIEFVDHHSKDTN